MIKKMSLITTGLLAAVMPVAFSVSCGSASKEGQRVEIEFPQKLLHDFNVVNNAALKPEVISKLKSLLSFGLKYGPEVSLLKEIRLVNDHDIPGLDEAALFSTTQTIAVNTKILKSLNLTNDIDQALYLFELIYHEYMHFVADNYFNNISSTNPNFDASIDASDAGNGQTKDHWSKLFLNAFKGAFNYDKHPMGKQPATLINDKYVSIASRYDAKDLFDIANDNTQTYSKLEGNEVMASANPTNELKTFWQIQKINPVIKPESLRYIYSMQELFARKGELAISPIIATVNTSDNNHEGFNQEAWINLKNKNQFWSPILQDVLNFADSLKGKAYLADGIDPNQSYDNIFLNQWKRKDEISLITYQNDSSLNNDGSETTKVDHAKVAIGGYVPSDKYKYLGFMNNGVFEGFELKIENGYYITPYVDAITIKGHPLMFATNVSGAETKAVETIYDDFGNEVNSNRDFDSSNEDYKITKTNHEISLT